MRVVKFNAIWCSGCIVMKNAMRDVEKLYPDFVYESYDYDMDVEEVKKYNVGDILPVLIFFKDDKEVSRLIGEKTKKEIIKEIERLS